VPEGGRAEARPEELGPSWVRVFGCEHRVGVESAEVHQGIGGRGAEAWMEETPAAGPSRRDGKSWERGKRKERPQSVVDCGSWVEERRQLPERRGSREKSFRDGKVRRMRVGKALGEQWRVVEPGGGETCVVLRDEGEPGAGSCCGRQCRPA